MALAVKYLFSRAPKCKLFSSLISEEGDEVVKSVVEILAHQRSKTRWSSVRFLLSSSRLTPCQVSRVALGIKSKPRLALRFFEFTLSHPTVFSHDLSSFSTLAHVFSRARLKNSAKEVMRLALRSPDSVNHSRPVMRFFDLLSSSYNECDSAPFVFDLLLMTCLDLRKTNEAVLIARKLISSGISPQALSCNALISAVTKLKGFSEGYSLFKEVYGLNSAAENKQMRKQRPTTSTFNSLAEGCLKHNEAEFVEEIRREMERLGCIPDSQTYSIFMQAQSEAGRIEEVKRLWEEMNAKELEPDVVCYNTVIGALCKAGSVAKAEEIERDMGEKGIEPTCATYEHLVRGLCATGDPGSALLMYNHMRRKTFDPLCWTVCMVIEALCEANMICEALAVKEGGAVVNLRETSYEALVAGLCEVGKVDEALNLQAEMAGKGFSPTQKMYHAFTVAFLQLGDRDSSCRLHLEMQNNSR